MSNSPAGTEVREGGGRGGAAGARAETPLQPVERTMVEQIHTLQPVEETVVEQVFPCNLWIGTRQCRRVFPEGTAACGEPMLEQV